MADFATIMAGVQSATSAASGATGLIPSLMALFGGKNYRQSLLARYTGSQLTGAEREANRFSANQAQLEREWQEKMYNQYESPAAMMRQYAEAGLNPALMYGGAGSPSPSFSGASPGSVSPTSGFDLVRDILDIAATKAQVKNLEADTEGKSIENQYKETLLSAEVATKWAQAENLVLQSEKSVAEKDKITAEIAEVVERTGLAKAEKAESIARAALIAAQEALTMTENVNAEKTGNILDNDVFVSNFDKKFVDFYGSRLNNNNTANIVLRALLRIADRHTGTGTGETDETTETE